MTLLQTLNKDVRSSVERVLYVLNPIRAIRLKVQDPLDNQQFVNISREIWKATARNIIEQVRAREARKGKLERATIVKFALKKAEASGLTDPAVSHAVAEMVMKLYIMGDEIPDNQL